MCTLSMVLLLSSIYVYSIYGSMVHLCLLYLWFYGPSMCTLSMVLWSIYVYSIYVNMVQEYSEYVWSDETFLGDSRRPPA